MKLTTNSIIHLLERFVLYLEKERLNLIGVFIVIFYLSLLRMWLEVELFNYNYKVFDYAHTVTFYFPVFVIGVFIMKIVTKEHLLKIANVICWGFLLIPIAPILDYFILNRSYGYDYMPKEAFLDVFLTFRPTEVAGVFQTLVLILFLSFSCIYVYVKTRSFSKSIVTFFSFWILIVTVSIPYINPLITSPRDISQTFFFLYYCLLTGIFILFILKASKKNLVTSLFKSLRPFPIFHGSAMVLLGIIIANNIDITKIIQYPLTDAFGITIISILTVVFAWCFTVLINHIYDIEIDRISGEQRITTKGLLKTDHIKQIAILFAILSFLFATLLSYQVFILTLIALFLGTIYSAPPFRLRNTMFSSLFIGMGSAIAFFIGTLTPPISYDKGLILLTPTVPSTALPIGIVIFIALSVGTVIKDLKNYEGDKKSGVRNIFTVYGIKTGVNIASVLLFVSFVSPLLLFHEMLDFLFVIPAGLFTVFLFKRFKKTELVFCLYFIVFLYFLLRWLGSI